MTSNLVYMCVFHNKDYIKLLNLLLNTIRQYKTHRCTFDVLVLTHPAFKDEIESLQHIHPIIVHCLKDHNTLFDAGCARLNIFDWEGLNKYTNILYLDTDVLLNNDLFDVFNIDINDEKIYAYEEGYISHDWWGGFLFDFSKISLSTTAFSSGVMLFKNCESNKQLFADIKQHAYDYIKTNPDPTCLDQPFIVYHVIMSNKKENTTLKQFMENNPTVIDGSKHIYHFPGSPGHYSSKYEKMNAFINMQTEYYSSIKNIYDKNKEIIEHHVRALEQIIRESGEPLEGNSFYYHLSLTRFNELYNKQVNLFHCGKYAKRKICEIGFNAGHSALLMLLARGVTPTDFLIFDIGEHKYMRPAFEYLQKVFPHVRFTLIVGDSTKTMPQWIADHPEEVGTYDVVHVDGGHSLDCITSDSHNSLQLAGTGALVIYDDVYVGYINDVVNNVIAKKQCNEWPLALSTVGYTHRIVVKQ